MVRVLASHHLDRFKSWRQRHLWVEFVVGSHFAPRGFFTFQFDLEHMDTFKKVLKNS